MPVRTPLRFLALTAITCAAMGWHPAVAQSPALGAPKQLQHGSVGIVKVTSNADAELRTAMEHMRQGKFLDARVILERLAWQYDNVDAINTLGVIYDFGLGVARNKQKALEYFLKAAERGDPKAQRNVARLYVRGEGVPLDYKKAADFYEKAAEAGDLNSMAELAILYLEGDGRPQDHAKVSQLLETSAAGGDPKGQQVLGILKLYGQAVPKDIQGGVELLRKSADQGYSMAMMALAANLMSGTLIPRDYVEGAQWMEKAADLGQRDAIWDMYRIYRRGYGVEQSYPTALKWYLIAQAAGHPKAKQNEFRGIAHVSKDQQNTAIEEANAWIAERQNRNPFESLEF